MSERRNSESLLGGYRVLDLADDKGLLCGRILAGWGADVIKIERPGGDPARNIGPFYKDIPHPEKSLFWFALNADKRGITLNIETADGRDIFKRLVKTADFVIESFPAGHMQSLSLGYPELERINPRIIMTSITPFGQTGPYAYFKATDMTVWALGGMMYLSGDPDRPPVQLGVPQAYFHGGIHAAMGSMVALYYRELTGEGQQVDVSCQEAVDFANMVEDEAYDLLKVNLARSGPFWASARPGEVGTLYEKVNYECKDGYVNVFIKGGGAGYKAAARAATKWLVEEGEPGPLKDYDWDTYNFATLTAEERRRLEEPFVPFFKTKTKLELLERAAKYNMILAPLNTVKDLVESPQLNARDYWVRVEHPELGDALLYPGAPVKTSILPWRTQRRAPLIGEHNDEVYGIELGLSPEQLAALKARGVI